MSIKYKQPILSYTMENVLDARDGNFIHHDEYTSQLEKPEIKYCYANTIVIEVKSSHYNDPEYYNKKTGKSKGYGLKYKVFILLQDFYKIAKDKEIDFSEAVEYALRYGDVHVRCTCPAFLYWGYAYIGTQLRYLYGLPRENRSPKIRNPNMKGTLCFAKGTKVWTSNGLKNIEDIKIGDKVFTHKGRLRRVIETSNHKETCLTEFKANNESIICSSNHPFYLCDRNKKFEFLPIGEVSHTRNRYFATSPKLECGTYEPPKGYAFMLGLYLSDGHLHRREVKENSNRIVKNPISHGKSCNQLSIAINNCYYDIYENYLNSIGIKINRYSKNNKSNCGDIFINDYKLLNFLVEYGNFTDSSTNDEKMISEKLLTWNSKSIREFLAGYFWGDGTLTCASGSSNYGYKLYATWQTTNPQMAQMLSILIRTQFWTSGIWKQNRKSVKFNINNREYVCDKPKDLYSIRITGNDVKLFLEDFPEISLIKGNTNKNRNYSNYSHKFINGYWLKPIYHKEFESEITVYNIGVEEDESYLVGIKGWAVHNCKHSDKAITYCLQNKQLIERMFETYYNRFKSGDKLIAVDSTGQTVTIGTKDGNGDVFFEKQLEVEREYENYKKRKEYENQEEETTEGTDDNEYVTDDSIDPLEPDTWWAEESEDDDNIIGEEE